MSVFICADLHGSRDRLDGLLECTYDDVVGSFDKFDVVKIEDGERPVVGDTIVIAGDAGLEYGGYTGYSLKKRMASLPYNFVVMRGNHDALYWDRHFDDDRWSVEDDFLFDTKYPNIKYVMDSGGYANIENHSFLFIPGGYSVDKLYRFQKDLPYEPMEELTYDDMDCILSDIDDYEGHADFVVSHVAPMKVEPYISHLFLSFIDQDSVSKKMEVKMDDMLDKLDYGRWYFGHYHHDIDVDEHKMSMVYNRMLKVC